MYTEYQPSKLLAPYIDKYWEFQGKPERGSHIHILPDGCTDFIFTLGEVANATDNSLIMQPYRSFFVGPMSQYSELVAYTDTVHMMGVRFHTCGLFRFMKLPLHELTDQRIDCQGLATIFDPFFTERLCEQPNLQSRIKLIEELFIKTLHKDFSANDQVCFAVRQIQLYQGKRPIGQLTKDICLCQRQLERKFKQFTGFSPKEYSRIVKFRHAVDLLRTSATDNLFSIAMEAGYYDVPHFTKEIKSLSGSTPRSFLSLPPEQDGTLTYIQP